MAKSSAIREEVKFVFLSVKISEGMICLEKISTRAVAMVFASMPLGNGWRSSLV